MSYSIYIGEMTEEREVDEDTGVPYLKVRVMAVTHPEAPTFPGDKMTGNSNSRHPGYSAWWNFLREAGLPCPPDDPRPFLVETHPGTRILTKADLLLVEEALARWKPTGPPGFKTDPRWDKDHDPTDANDYDGVLARLRWLKWWMTWALENCERPAVYNR